MDNSNSYKMVAILSTLCVALGIVLTVVALYGGDPALTKIMGYFSSAVPVIIGFGFLARRQEKNDEVTNEAKETAGQIESHVGDLSSSLNGKLDARFSRIEDTINSLTDALDAYTNSPTDIVKDEIND